MLWSSSTSRTIGLSSPIRASAYTTPQSAKTVVSPSLRERAVLTGRRDAELGPIPVPELELAGEVPLPSASHMALDEVLLDAVAGGRRPPLLRFWGWTQPTLVLGSNQAVANEVDLEAAGRRGFTIVRRLSGGGTMLAEPGRT